MDVKCEGSWEKDGECNAECDGTAKIATGKQKKVYKITKDKEFNGQACDHKNGEITEEECQKTDCNGTLFLDILYSRVVVGVLGIYHSRSDRVYRMY